ncbi:MAG: hypothetical protein KGJ36_06370 [Acidobacteriota bacterium]|nr:hypothetical protein [Acidobacteriota bacterium]
MGGLVAASGAGASASGTLRVAEAPGANPNYIFPFAGCAYATANNLNQFQALMYRPLYWFGLGGSTTLTSALSLAKAPLFSNGNRTVTISLKGWRFASGQVVDARSVMFFLNLYRADPSAYCGYNAGFGIPDQVRSATGSGLSVRITFTGPVNPNWILYNYLSEITPMPNAWDRVSATQAGGCAGGTFGAAETATRCKAVEAYLDALALNPATFTGSLWRAGVDGPWRLSAFDAAGNATFVPNPHYGGPRHAQLSAVKLVAYATAAAEEQDLKAGKLDLGYVDPSLLGSAAPAQGGVGANWPALASRYSLLAGTTWSFNYAAFNFASADPESAALNQLYIRQALQEAVDQATIVRSAYRGYATSTDSPLPPRTPASLAKAVPNPYPFSLVGAAAVLAAHGWTNVGGVLTCTSPGTGPGQCGPGIDANYTLALNVVWASGSPALDATMDSVVASWQKLGVQVTPSTASFNTVVADCNGGSGFEICSWGTGWTYSPNYYPSGESLFAPGGGFNIGSYSDPQMASLIKATTSGTASLSAYATYAAKQLPVLYLPQAMRLVEVAKSLKSSIGFAPNPLGNFTPEYFRY